MAICCKRFWRAARYRHQRDLAAGVHDHYSQRFVRALDNCELAICACDLGEVIGSRFALNLLFKSLVMGLHQRWIVGRALSAKQRLRTSKPRCGPDPDHGGSFFRGHFLETKLQAVLSSFCSAF